MLVVYYPAIAPRDASSGTADLAGPWRFLSGNRLKLAASIRLNRACRYQRNQKTVPAACLSRSRSRLLGNGAELRMASVISFELAAHCRV